MLNRITLTNFRQHRNLAITLGAGFSTIRGANEGGKSTILEAIAYALYGVKALRDSLSDVVTWGEEEKSLKVELDLSVDNVQYTVTRSKGGAEVVYDGGRVTGQTEVSSFIAKILRVDAGAAARLSIANQSAIRGALEEGPKATTELIEKLSDFDAIDNLIELMSEKLTLGSSAQLDASITQVEQDLALAKEQAVQPDTASAKQRLVEASSAVQFGEMALTKAETEERAAQEDHAQVREMIVRREGLVREAGRAAATLAQAKHKLDSATVPEHPGNVDVKIEELRKQLDDVERASEIADLHKLVSTNFQRDPHGSTFEGTYAELIAEICKAEQAKMEASDDVTRLTGDIKLFKQQLTQGTCTFCGKDFSGVPEVMVKNQKLLGQIERAEADLKAAWARKASVLEDLPILANIHSAQNAADKRVAGALQYLEVVPDNHLPSIWRWVGPDVGVPVDASSIRNQINRLKDAAAAYSIAATRRSEAATQVTLAQAAADATQAELDKCPEVSMEFAQKRLDNARDLTRAARETLGQAKVKKSSAEHEIKDAEAAYTLALRRVTELEARLEEQRKARGALEFNNALVKRVRQCRPLISDKLWHVVLQAVSGYFSEMRGVRSRVTKDSGGFKVDGHSVTSMSGSTLDALGLAIRVALVRTFLPMTPFLLLDEPCAAADDNRTGNMLGFLSSSGFSQMIVCSHDPLSESICDHLIKLGD